MRPALHGVVDADGDEAPEVFVSVRGHVLALDARTGDTEWKTTVVPDTLVFAPVVGDLDADGDAEVVATSNDGTVWVLDANSGDVLASYNRDVKIWTHATVSDYDGDGRDEVLVVFGDGRVVSLSYRAAE
ncbi:FG-GAP-like repeat-containing protein [Halospeciosus flavus]|uniref:FG-GAP-like repeat-containing protein n=1 Tax=Halospeciosus flavus TaxID=3032283 RepID=UPI0036140D72